MERDLQILNLYFRLTTKIQQWKRTIAISHLTGVEQLTLNLDESHIFNMDETPVYVDMVSSTTLDFIGSKNVGHMTIGHEKCRFTVVITISAAGKMLKSYVIFKGLKNVPKCNVPVNIVLKEAGSS